MTPQEITELVNDVTANRRTVPRSEQMAWQYAFMSSGLTADGAWALVAKLLADPALSDRPLRPADISRSLGKPSVLDTDEPEPGSDWNDQWNNVLAAVSQHGVTSVRSEGDLTDLTRAALSVKAVWHEFTTGKQENAMWRFRDEYTALAAGRVDTRHQPRLPTGTAPQVHASTDTLADIEARQHHRPGPQLRNPGVTDYRDGMLRLVDGLKPDQDLAEAEPGPATATGA